MNHNRLKNKRNNNAKRKNGLVFNYLCEKLFMQKKRNTSRQTPRFGANKNKNTSSRKKFDGPRFARNDGSLAEDYSRDSEGRPASRGGRNNRISTGDKPAGRRSKETGSYSPRKRGDGFSSTRKNKEDKSEFYTEPNERKRAPRSGGSAYSENKRPARTGDRSNNSRKPSGNRFSRETRDDSSREFKPRESRDSFAPRKRAERSPRNEGEERYGRAEKAFDKRGRSRTRPTDSPRKRSARPTGNQSEEDYNRGEKPFDKRSSSRPRSTEKFSRETTERKSAKRFSEKPEGPFAPRERSERPTRQADDNRYKNTKRPAEKRSGKDNGKKEDAAAKEGIRLNKYIANAGICSRREADEYIRSGVVTVNGKAITEMGYQVQAGDVVKFGDRAIRAEKPVYILLNKPKDYITTTDDPDGRHIVTELVKVKERVFPVGRLDRNTTGVLLLTNDGDLAERLMHPKYEVPKVYLALLDKRMEKRHMEQLLEGVELEDGFIVPDELAYVEGDKKKIGVVIHSGRNRIVHRMFNHLGYSVEKLDRTSYAGLTKRDLKRSEWRMLTTEEVISLKRLVKLKGKY
jgi:23S rRNA pseudouridine2605 synthase